MSYCARCKENGHLCEAQQGFDLCVFCEDGVQCPKANEVSPETSGASVPESETSVMREKLLCKCGCGQPATKNRDFKWGHKLRAAPVEIPPVRAVPLQTSANGASSAAPKSGAQAKAAGFWPENGAQTLGHLRALEARLQQELTAVQTVMVLLGA